jgi:hypothetical protein
MGNIDDPWPSWPGYGGFAFASLRVFNRETGLWSTSWADTASGRVFPPLVGGFVDGVGECLGDERMAWRRYLFTGRGEVDTRARLDDVYARSA